MNNRGGEGARLGLPDIDDGFLFRLCEAAAGSGGMVCPHPETIEIAWVLRNRLKLKDPDGKGGLATWNATRPPFVEADAVQRAAYLASTVGAPLYVVHTSSEQALLAALRHRRDGVAVHIETCPHYLTHDVSWSGGDMGKINPPLREASDREALWRALLCGDIDSRCHCEGGRYLGGIAGLSRPRDPVAGVAHRGPSEARHATRARRRGIGHHSGAIDGARPVQGINPCRLRRRSDLRRPRQAMAARGLGRGFERRLFDL
jgi:hypothetical protein